ncbi:Sensors of blue-light using FAD [Catalinimonas alkaloidigena]|uniref:Sensors of blue-light using FAD n=1 Tax=Catalinimonas alkaloidigena TaxID=1075417 RepID=A0A1G9TFZ1_9BACT|nr:BLUF domain-containing protein [Catalinimonas alkaloidigena]SDM46646.1 Sensors of blue-light using FAD [Catalinimonas alkaloidigena]
MLSQLVYVSQRQKACTSAEIDRILAACQKNNPALGITGVLLYSDTQFIQLVEGDYKVLMGLYEKIQHDARHHQPRMISVGPIRQKTFPSWHMGSKKLGEGKVDFHTDITPEDRVLFSRLLMGKEANGQQVLGLLKKFF